MTFYQESFNSVYKFYFNYKLITIYILAKVKYLLQLKK